MFMVALFVIAQKEKQPRYPSTDEGINKMWETYTMEYYLKKSEILTTYYNMDEP